MTKEELIKMRQKFMSIEIPWQMGQGRLAACGLALCFLTRCRLRLFESRNCRLHSGHESRPSGTDIAGSRSGLRDGSSRVKISLFD